MKAKSEQDLLGIKPPTSYLRDWINITSKDKSGVVPLPKQFAIKLEKLINSFDFVSDAWIPRFWSWVRKLRCYQDAAEHPFQWPTHQDANIFSGDGWVCKSQAQLSQDAELAKKTPCLEWSEMQVKAVLKALWSKGSPDQRRVVDLGSGESRLAHAWVAKFQTITLVEQNFDGQINAIKNLQKQKKNKRTRTEYNKRHFDFVQEEMLGIASNQGPASLLARNRSAVCCTLFWFSYSSFASANS